MAEQPASLHVVVIGAGIIGAAVAMELLAEGHRVSIVEPASLAENRPPATATGAWPSPGSVVPMSVPGLWRKVPVYLADPLGPVAVNWRYFPLLLPWLVRYANAGATIAKVEAIARALAPLLAELPVRHKRLAEAAGVGELIERRGLLHVFPSRADFEAEALAWRLRRENGVEWIELDRNELRQREPDLDRRYTFGVLVEAGGHCTDPGFYVAALVREAEARGAQLHRARAHGFGIEHHRLAAVRTDAGDIACDRAVIAAGAFSKPLAAAAGDRVSLETERGYHATILGAECGPRTPLMPSDGKMAHTITRGGLRIAGQVELAGLAAPAELAACRDSSRLCAPHLPSFAPQPWPRTRAVLDGPPPGDAGQPSLHRARFGQPGHRSCLRPRPCRARRRRGDRPVGRRSDRGQAAFVHLSPYAPQRFG